MNLNALDLMQHFLWRRANLSPYATRYAQRCRPMARPRGVKRTKIRWLQCPRFLEMSLRAGKQCIHLTSNVNQYIVKTKIACPGISLFVKCRGLPSGFTGALNTARTSQRIASHFMFVPLDLHGATTVE